MIIKILFSVLIVTLGHGVLSAGVDTTDVNQRNVARPSLSSYRYNHPPEAENYQGIPVAIVYEETPREEKILKARVSTNKKTIPKENLSVTKSSEKTEETTVTINNNNSDDVELKQRNDIHIKKQKSLQLKTGFEKVLQIPVAVVYDEPNTARSIERNNKVNTGREQVRGFKLRKLQDQPNESSNFKTQTSEVATQNKEDTNGVATPKELTKPQRENGNRTQNKKDTNVVNKPVELTNLQRENGNRTQNKAQRENGNRTQNKAQKENGNRTQNKTQRENGNRTQNKDDTNVAKPVELTKPQRENGNRTQNKDDTNVVAKTVELTKPQRENGNRTQNKDDANIVVKPVELTNSQKENGNRTVSSIQLDSKDVSRFAKRNGTRDPVVPIIESENHVYAQSGDFTYSYEGGDGTKAFSKGTLKSFEDDKTGEAVEGGFSYKDKEGNDFSLSYTADENGYRPVGAHLPTPPPIPIAIARALRYLATKTTPEPVTEPSVKPTKAHDNVI